MVETIVQQLQAVGLSGYEAKAYASLVQAGQPLNGYEVAKRSGVPRSTVYEVLAKLVSRSAAYELANDGGAVEYVPLSPTMLLSRLRLQMDDAVTALESSFQALSSPSQARLTHTLTGRDGLLGRCQDVVMSATTDVFVSVWPEELADLRPVLRRAVVSGVDVSVLCFGEIGERIGYCYEHEFSSPDVVLDNVGCKLMVVAADRDIVMQLLMRRTSDDEAIQEYWRTASELMRLRSDHGEPAEHLRRMIKARERR